MLTKCRNCLHAFPPTLKTKASHICFIYIQAQHDMLQETVFFSRIRKASCLRKDYSKMITCTARVVFQWLDVKCHMTDQASWNIKRPERERAKERWMIYATIWRCCRCGYHSYSIPHNTNYTGELPCDCFFSTKLCLTRCQSNHILLLGLKSLHFLHNNQ